MFAGGLGLSLVHLTLCHKMDPSKKFFPLIPAHPCDMVLIIHLIWRQEKKLGR